MAGQLGTCFAHLLSDLIPIRSLQQVASLTAAGWSPDKLSIRIFNLVARQMAKRAKRAIMPRLWSSRFGSKVSLFSRWCVEIVQKVWRVFSEETLFRLADCASRPASCTGAKFTANVLTYCMIFCMIHIWYTYDDLYPQELACWQFALKSRRANLLSQTTKLEWHIYQFAVNFVLPK